MKKNFTNLNISKRLLLIASAGITTFLISVILITSTFSYIKNTNGKLSNIAETLFRQTEISVSYNGMRGDLYNLLTSKSSDQQIIKEVKERFEKRKEEMNNNKAFLIANNHDPELEKPIEDFLKIADKIPAFIDQNMSLLGQAENDSIFTLAKNKILVEFEPNYLATRSIRRAIGAKILENFHIKEEDAKSHINQTFWLITILFLVSSLFILFITNLMGKSFTEPIHRVKQALQELTEGKLPDIRNSNSKSELGEMINSLKNVINNLINLKEFTASVGKGNFDTNVEIFQNKGEIASSLIMMRDNLKEAAEKDKQGRWISDGIAETGKLLRQKYKDENELYNAMLSFAVRYLSVNQGSLFVVAGEDTNPTLELVAAWAYNRKKYLSKTIAIGEGLVGQAYLEKQPVILTAIPANYLHITSGLGNANPRNIVILPLMANETVQGVLEIASFTILSNHHLEFLKQFSESMAAEIAVSKTNSITRQLLETSQQQTEMMQAQEEEMRQNMEEMQATQEEMQRNTTEIEARMKALDESGISFIEFDTKGRILNANRSFLEKMGHYALNEIQGKHHSLFTKPGYAQTDEYKKFWDDLANGKALYGEFERISKTGETMFLMGSYSPVRDINGNIKKVVKFAVDITNNRKLLDESREMTEQMTAQESMMREILEEMQLSQTETLNQKDAEINNLQQRIKELETKVNTQI